MTWPVFEKASTKTVAPAGDKADFVCKGTDDDIVIQQAIDSLPEAGGKVFELPGTLILGNCIRPRDNTELEIQGTLKVADAVTSLLTADVRSGDKTAQVADPNEKHQAGRNYGESVMITGISGNAIAVPDPRARKWANSSIALKFDSYQVVRKGYVTTSHNAILVLMNNRVYIHGANKQGDIDGNNKGQSPTAPLTCIGLKEDLRANCVISICDST